MADFIHFLMKKDEVIVKCVWKFFFYQLHAQDCYGMGYADI